MSFNLPVKYLQVGYQSVKIQKTAVNPIQNVGFLRLFMDVAS